MADYEGFIEQHLLLAAAGVQPGDGYYGYYMDLEGTMQIGTSKHFRLQVSTLVTAYMRLLSVRARYRSTNVLQRLARERW